MLEETEDTEFTVVEDVEVTTFDPAPLGLRAGNKRRGWIEAVSTLIRAPISRDRRQDRVSSPGLPAPRRRAPQARMVTAPAEDAALVDDIPALARIEPQITDVAPPPRQVFSSVPAPAMAAAGVGWMVPALPAVALPYRPMQLGIDPAHRRLLARIVTRVVAPAVFIVLAIGAMARVIDNPGAASASLDDVRPTVTQRVEVHATQPAPEPAVEAPVAQPPVVPSASEPTPEVDVPAPAAPAITAEAAPSMVLEQTPAPAPATVHHTSRTHAAHPARARMHRRVVGRGHRRVRLDAGDTSSALGRMRPGRAF